MAAATRSHRASVRCQDGSSKKKGSEYFESVSQFAVQYKDECFPIKKLPGSYIKITPLEDTIYSDKPDEVEEWGMFYLPKIVEMKVLGVVEGTSCPCDELVLMTCEDKRLFICDGEELHVVGRGLKQLRNGEVKYPSNKTYYNGEAFKDMTEKDWEKVKKGPVGQKLEEEHKELVEKIKPSLLENLKITKNAVFTAGVPKLQPAGRIRPTSKFGPAPEQYQRGIAIFS